MWSCYTKGHIHARAVLLSSIPLCQLYGVNLYLTLMPSCVHCTITYSATQLNLHPTSNSPTAIRLPIAKVESSASVLVFQHPARCELHEGVLDLLLWAAKRINKSQSHHGRGVHSHGQLEDKAVQLCIARLRIKLPSSL